MNNQDIEKILKEMSEDILSLYEAQYKMAKVFKEVVELQDKKIAELQNKPKCRLWKYGAM